MFLGSKLNRCIKSEITKFKCSTLLLHFNQSFLCIEANLALTAANLDWRSSLVAFAGVLPSFAVAGLCDVVNLFPEVFIYKAVYGLGSPVPPGIV